MSLDPATRLTDADRLAAARALRQRADACEVGLLEAACGWADAHPPASAREAAFEDEHLPGISWEHTAAFALAIGLSDAGGTNLIHEALELRHRLPRTWRRLRAGRLTPWRARRIAQRTIHHPDDVAARVDAEVAPIANRVGPLAIDRLIQAATAALHPEEYQRQLDAARESRRVRLLDEVDAQGVGLMQIWADHKDLLDFDDLVSEVAAALAVTGDTDPLDVRRAKAIGVLADPAGALDLLDAFTRPAPPAAPDPHQPAPDGHEAPAAPGTAPGSAPGSAQESDPGSAPGSAAASEPTPEPGSTPEPGPGAEPGPAAASDPGRTPAPGAGRPATAASSSRRRPRKRARLVLHLSAEALTGHGAALGRCERDGGVPVLAEQIREWCGRSDTHLVVQPVIDLAAHQHVTAYQVPDRTRTAVEVRDLACVFPRCTRTATRCDMDHVLPWLAPEDPDGPGGLTCPHNLAPLCRRHHRLKTLAGWTYRMLAPGIYLWRSPHGDEYLHHHGETSVIDPCLQDEPRTADRPQTQPRTQDEPFADTG